MKLSISTPKDLEAPLKAEAAKHGESPSKFVPSSIRARLEQGGRSFSDPFAALAGSWEDSRSAEEIVRDIEESRRSVRQLVLH